MDMPDRRAWQLIGSSCSDKKGLHLYFWRPKNIVSFPGNRVACRVAYYSKMQHDVSNIRISLKYKTPENLYFKRFSGIFRIFAFRSKTGDGGSRTHENMLKILRNQAFSFVVLHLVLHVFKMRIYLIYKFFVLLIYSVSINLL